MIVFEDQVKLPRSGAKAPAVSYPKKRPHVAWVSKMRGQYGFLLPPGGLLEFYHIIIMLTKCNNQCFNKVKRKQEAYHSAC